MSFAFDALERAVAKAHGLTIVDIVGFAFSLYLTVCLYPGAAQ